MKVSIPQVTISFLMVFTVIGISTNFLTLIGWSAIDEVVFLTSVSFEGFALRHFLWGSFVNLTAQLHHLLPHLIIFSVFAYSLLKFSSLYQCSQIGALIFVSPVILLYAQTVLRDFTYLSILLLILCNINSMQIRSKYYSNLIMLLFLLTAIAVFNPISVLTLTCAFMFALLVMCLGKWRAISAFFMSIFVIILFVDVTFPKLSIEILDKVARTDQTCESLGYWGNFNGDSITIFTVRQLIGNLFIFENLGITFLFKVEHFLYVFLIVFAVYQAKTRKNFNNSLCVGILLMSFFQLAGENCEWSLIRHKILFYAPLLILLSKERTQHTYKPSLT